MAEADMDVNRVFEAEPRFADYTVDADVHVTPPPTFWAEYLSLRHKPGAKNIMWSSDYPHSETTFPHSHAVIAKNFAGVPKAEMDWIVAGCAEKFFGLG